MHGHGYDTNMIRWNQRCLKIYWLCVSNTSLKCCPHDTTSWRKHLDLKKKLFGLYLGSVLNLIKTHKSNQIRLWRCIVDAIIDFELKLSTIILWPNCQSMHFELHQKMKMGTALVSGYCKLLYSMTISGMTIYWILCMHTKNIIIIVHKNLEVLIIFLWYHKKKI